MKSALKLLIILISATLLFTQNRGYVWAQLATNTATFSVSPVTGSFSDNFSVDVKVTTATGTSISTLRADIVYPSDKLEVTSLDTSGSIVPAQPNGTWLNLDKNTPGVITLSATITTSYTTAAGAQPGQFAKINFKVKSGGTATLTFQNTSAIYLYQPGATTATNILSSSTGGTYTVSTSGGTGGTTTTPTPTASTGGNLPNAGNEIPTLILIASGVSLVLLGSKKLLFSSL